MFTSSIHERESSLKRGLRSQQLGARFMLTWWSLLNMKSFAKKSLHRWTLQRDIFTVICFLNSNSRVVNTTRMGKYLMHQYTFIFASSYIYYPREPICMQFLFYLLNTNCEISGKRATLYHLAKMLTITSVKFCSNFLVSGNFMFV